MQTVNIFTLLQDVLKEIGPNAPAPGIKLFYGTLSEQNHDAESETVWPKAYMDAPLQSDFSVVVTGDIAEAFPVRLFFCEKAALTDGAFDMVPADQQTTCGSMRAFIKEFIVRLSTYTIPNDGRPAFNIKGAAGKIYDVVDFPTNVALIGAILEIMLPVNSYSGICYTNVPPTN